MTLPKQIAPLVQPWNKLLTATQVRVLQQFVADHSVPLAGLRVEGLRTATRLLCKNPNMGYEEVHYFALQMQLHRERNNPEVCWYVSKYPEQFVKWE